MRAGAAPSDRGYRPEIDGLRAVAVAAVILYHAHVPFASGGFIGVDVFFVVSGYLIAGIIYADMVAGRFRLRAFFERRARRILPALFAMLAACVPAAWLLLTPSQLRGFGESLVAVSVFLSNQYFLYRTGYFGPSAQEIPLLHAWTLSVEEQFYLVLPIGLLLLMRYSSRWLIPALWLMGTLSFLLSVRYTTTAPLLNFFQAAPRAWEFLAGSILAVSAPQSGGSFNVSRPLAELCSLIGMGLLSWSLVAYDDATPFPGIAALAPVLGTTMIIATATSRTVVGKVLSLQPLVWLGLISYSAYLWHHPVLSFYLAATGGRSDGVTTVLLLFLILLLAFLSWRFIEVPARDQARASARAVWITSALGTSTAFAVGFLCYWAQGFPGRFSVDQNLLADSAAPSPFRAECNYSPEGGPLPNAACRYFESPATWAILGDSHGIEIAAALAERLRRSSAGGVLHLTATGCQPAIGFESNMPGCERWLQDALDRIRVDPGVTNVVVVYRHSFYLYGSQLRDFPVLPHGEPHFRAGQNPDEARERYWQGLLAVISQLRDAGKRVWVLDPVPELGRIADWYVYNRKMTPTQIDRMRGPDRAYYEGRNSYILGRLDSLPVDSDLRRVRTADALCTAYSCLVGDGKQLFYFDDNHLSMTGARRVIARISSRDLSP